MDRHKINITILGPTTFNNSGQPQPGQGRIHFEFRILFLFSSSGLGLQAFGNFIVLFKHETKMQNLKFYCYIFHVNF